MHRKVVLLLIMLCTSPIAAEEKELSPESQKFLNDFRDFARQKTQMTVEVNSLLMSEMTSSWRYQLDTDKSIESFINACIAGYYDDTASKKIGALMVHEGKITENQYNNLRNKCIGGKGVLMKTKYIWQKLIQNSKASNLPLSTLVE